MSVEHYGETLERIIYNSKLVTGLVENTMHGNVTPAAITKRTPDVQDAFNAANCNLIMRSLTATGVLGYITTLVDSYLTGKRLWYDTDSGTKEYIVSAAVPQGSVPEPLLLTSFTMMSSISQLLARPQLWVTLME